MADDEEPGQKYSHDGNPIAKVHSYVEGWSYEQNFTTGSCEIKTVDVSEVTREMLTTSEVPIMIKGLTKNWSAHERWGCAPVPRHHRARPPLALARAIVAAPTCSRREPHCDQPVPCRARLPPPAHALHCAPGRRQLQGAHRTVWR